MLSGEERVSDMDPARRIPVKKVEQLPRPLKGNANVVGRHSYLRMLCIASVRHVVSPCQASSSEP
jgi:hypothetical protein